MILKLERKKIYLYIIYLYYYIINHLRFFLYNQDIIKYIHTYIIKTNKIHRHLNKVIFYKRRFIKKKISICIQNKKKKKMNILSIMKFNYIHDDLYKKNSYMNYQIFYQIFIKRNSKKITNIKNICSYKKKQKCVKKINTNERYKQKKQYSKKYKNKNL